MFKWYFKFDFIENNVLFWLSIAIILSIIITTVFLVRKALKDNVNK